MQTKWKCLATIPRLLIWSVEIYPGHVWQEPNLSVPTRSPGKPDPHTSLIIKEVSGSVPCILRTELQPKIRQCEYSSRRDSSPSNNSFLTVQQCLTDMVTLIHQLKQCKYTVTNVKRIGVTMFWVWVFSEYILSRQHEVLEALFWYYQRRQI